jgi:plasmid stabilization system protein ParE
VPHDNASIRFAAEAKADFRDAVFWYEEQRPGLGDEFSRAVRAAAHLIASGPERWPARNGLRRYILDRFPYTIAYRFASGSVEILAVAHHSRDPASWTDRR